MHIAPCYCLQRPSAWAHGLACGETNGGQTGNIGEAEQRRHRGATHTSDDNTRNMETITLA